MVRKRCQARTGARRYGHVAFTRSFLFHWAGVSLFILGRKAGRIRRLDAWRRDVGSYPLDGRSPTVHCPRRRRALTIVRPRRANQDSPTDLAMNRLAARHFPSDRHLRAPSTRNRPTGSLSRVSFGTTSRRFQFSVIAFVIESIIR